MRGDYNGLQNHLRQQNAKTHKIKNTLNIIINLFRALLGPAEPVLGPFHYAAEDALTFATA